MTPLDDFSVSMIYSIGRTFGVLAQLCSDTDELIYTKLYRISISDRFWDA